MIVALGAFVAAFFSLRKLEGAIPGEAAILSLGVIEEGYLVGTADGLYRSSDAKTWSLVKGYSKGRVLVASNADKAFIHHDGLFFETEDLKGFDGRFGAVQPAIAIAVDDKGNIYLAEKANRFALIRTDGSLQTVQAVKGPREVLAIEGIPGEPVVVLAGGLTSGFWRSLGGDSPWTHILKTPTRAILADPNVEDRVFIGTAGGVLFSKDEGFKWAFTEMRLPVEALAELGGRYYAVTEDRLVYVSKDGLKDWRRVST